MWNLLTIVAFIFTVLFVIAGSIAAGDIENRGLNLTFAWIISGILFNPMIVVLAYAFPEPLDILLIALVVYDMVVPMGLLFWSAFNKQTDS